jgi:hypothetical protein
LTYTVPEIFLKGPDFFAAAFQAYYKGGMRRLIYYSVALSHEQPRPDLLWQLEASIRSLRQFNRAAPIVVFAYDDVPPDLARTLTPYDVRVVHQGSYKARLARDLPHGWQVLAGYPLLHKFLNFDAIAALAPEQVLFLDCDTLFFNDVDALFTRYASAHCCAREEPTTRRSHYGYEPRYLDEDAMASIARACGIAVPPPFNLGVVLMNHGLAARLAALQPAIVRYAWRFLVWMALNPLPHDASAYGEGAWIAQLRAQLDRYAHNGEREAALPYPSANRWILDQFALWFALGHLQGLTYADFSPREVLQNGEVLHHAAPSREWVVCHYYSQNLNRLDAWIRRVNASRSCSAGLQSCEFRSV